MKVPGLAGTAVSSALANVASCTGLSSVVGALLGPDRLSGLIGGVGECTSSPRSPANVASSESIGVQFLCTTTLPVYTDNLLSRVGERWVNGLYSRTNKFIRRQLVRG